MASSPQFNTTSMVLNPAEQPEPQRTYVMFGTRRGGTSMTAGVLRALGLDLGDVGRRKNNEDPNFQSGGPTRMRAAIEKRNAEQDVWGWKFPAAATYLPAVFRSIRNPFLVVVYRDPVAAALSQARLDGRHNRRSARISLHEGNANTNMNTGFVLATDRPCLLISNEKALHDPSPLIDELADFLHAPRPGDELRAQILDYMAPGQYKSFDEFFGT